MSGRNKKLIIGPFGFQLPETWTVSVELTKCDGRIPNQELTTFWKIDAGRFYFSIFLNTGDLSDLARFIEISTRKTIAPTQIKIGGINGMEHGDYALPRTWIDWWFKEQDVMVCIKLLSHVFPHTEPTQVEVDDNYNFISSIQYLPIIEADTNE